METKDIMLRITQYNLDLAPMNFFPREVYHFKARKVFVSEWWCIKLQGHYFPVTQNCCTNSIPENLCFFLQMRKFQILNSSRETANNTNSS